MRLRTTAAVLLALFAVASVAPVAAASSAPPDPSFHPAWMPPEAGSGVRMPPAQVVLEERQGYNTDYLFGMSRGVANSTITPAVKPLLFLFTIPLDIAFLPFAAIGGFF